MYIIMSKTLYQLNTETGKKSVPPEKCYHCNRVNKVGEICKVSECEV